MKEVNSLVISDTNADVDATAENIQSAGGSYNYVTTASTLSIVSDAAGDTTQTLTITGLDSNYAPATEVVTLTGTTPVVTTTSFRRVFSVTASAATAGAIAFTPNVAALAAGTLQWTTTTYTIPAGDYAHLVNVRFSSSSAATAELRVRELGGVWKPLFTTEATAADHNFVAPPLIPAKADIELRAANGTNARVHGSYELWIY